MALKLKQKKEPFEHEADGRTEQSVRQTERKGERVCVSAKEAVSDGGCEIR